VGGRECVSRARPRPLSRPSFESDRTVRRRASQSRRRRARRSLR
jgi:hypothetical protein